MVMGAPRIVMLKQVFEVGTTNIEFLLLYLEGGYIFEGNNQCSLVSPLNGSGSVPEPEKEWRGVSIHLSGPCFSKGFIQVAESFADHLKKNTT